MSQYDNVLLKDILLVTPGSDGFLSVIENAVVAVADGVYIYVGNDYTTAAELMKDKAFRQYSGKNKLIWPAMANTHSHIPMTLMRNQADDLNLHDWLFNLIFPMEEKLVFDHVYWGSKLGIAEMIRNGIGASADMYYYSDAVAKAAQESGFRLNVCCDGKTNGRDGNTHVDKRVLCEFRDHWQNNSNGLINTSLLVHSIYLYDSYLYHEMSEAAAELGMYIQVHVSETSKEVDDCINKYGCRPPEQLDRFGIFSGRTIAAHCVHLNDEDRKILADRNVFIAHNPTSNLKLGSGFADINKMIESGICVSLGTDGAASNNSLNLYNELRLASLLAKGINMDAGCLPAKEMIKIATLNGMKGLGFNNSGCIETDWSADFQILDIDTPAMNPLGKPDAAIVYSADGGNVESLMVNGRWLMEKRELKTIDEEKVLFEANRCSNEIK
jgi:5-methylthioadenosine/S-adenosylhomocysteine deaminase